MEINDHRHERAVSSKIVVAVVSGKHWNRACVEFQSNNQAVVPALSSRSVQNPQIMHLLRCLFFLEAYFGFEQCARYSPGKENATHGALSRVCISEFRSLSPQAAKEPTPVPPSLAQLLLDLPLNLTFPTSWKALFAASLSKVFQTPPPKPTRRLETATSSSVLSTTFPLCLSTSAQSASLSPSSPSRV